MAIDKRLALVKKREHVKCCKRAKVLSSLSDGVLVGSCSKCGRIVLKHAKTGKVERVDWLCEQIRAIIERGEG